MIRRLEGWDIEIWGNWNGLIFKDLVNRRLESLKSIWILIDWKIDIKLIETYL